MIAEQPACGLERTSRGPVPFLFTRFIDPRGFMTAAGVSPIVMSFRNATPGQQPLTVPGSTDAVLAVKTERFPPYGLPPITARR
jgi:hypothetical protein